MLGVEREIAKELPVHPLNTQTQKNKLKHIKIRKHACDEGSRGNYKAEEEDGRGHRRHCGVTGGR